jgi:hypothetical protein
MAVARISISIRDTVAGKNEGIRPVMFFNPCGKTVDYYFTHEIYYNLVVVKSSYNARLRFITHHLKISRLNDPVSMEL